MIDNTIDFAAQALQILKTKLDDWQSEPATAFNSTWPVFERLIARHDEMKPVYSVLEEEKINGQRLWVFLEQCIFAGAYATSENHATLRADYSELQTLCEDISRTAIRLETLLRRRSDILNRSGCFSIDRMIRLTDYIDAAGCENSLYRHYIQPKLDELGSFDLKYWPDIPDILQVVGSESTEVLFLDRTTEAIVNAKRPSLTDFFIDFFGRLQNISDNSPYGLPIGFRLSDSSLSTLSNIICDLQPDQMVDAVYIKRLRQRLRSQGIKSVW